MHLSVQLQMRGYLLLAYTNLLHNVDSITVLLNALIN